MSLTAAFYLDPVRDIYEVEQLDLAFGNVMYLQHLGIYHLYLSSASHQLSRGRTFAHRHDAGPSTRPSPLASEPVPCQS